MDEIRETERTFNASMSSPLKVDTFRPSRSLAKRIPLDSSGDDPYYGVTSPNRSSGADRSTAEIGPRWKLLGEKGLPARPSGSDRRMFHPMGANAPYVTTTGNVARISPTAQGSFRFHSRISSVPCIQRVIRREVLFAKKKHGAHYSRRRRRPVSFLEC